MTEGVRYARDFWSEARTLFKRTEQPTGLKRFCKNVVSTGTGFTVVPDVMTMLMCGCGRGYISASSAPALHLRGDERLLFGRTSAADAHWQLAIVERRTTPAVP